MRTLAREQHDLTVYRVLVFSIGRLRCAFTLRFSLVSAVGALAGSVLSAVFTDPMVDRVMRFNGISGFASHPGLVAILLPGTVIVLLFSGFAYVVSGKMNRLKLNTLIAE